MNNLKNILTILAVGLTLTSFRQTTINSHSKNYQVLAKLISFEGGDKIHFAKFKVIKNFSETLNLDDTITVGYYNYKQPDSNIENVFLTLEKYGGQTTIRNYFICPNYDGKTYIQKAKLEFISFDYWEGCETGKGDCKPLTFTRTKTESNWFLIMPCGGTETAITISGQNFIKEIHIFHNNCPPYLNLSNLTDGKYLANMRADGIGGTVTFNLVTKK